MNYIMTPDYIIFDINKKFNELAEYVNTVTETGEDIHRVKQTLVDFYNLYKNSFGKSVKTYLLAVNSAIVSISYSEVQEDKVIPDRIIENMVAMGTSFDEVEKSICSGYFFPGSKNMLNTIKDTEGKVICLGNSQDDLDDKKAMQVHDAFEERIFDDIYNMTNNNQENLETIFKTSNINPENTILITADLSQAHAAVLLDVDVYFMKRRRIEIMNMDFSVNNFNKLFFNPTNNDSGVQAFADNHGLNNYLYEGAMDVAHTR